MMRKTAVFYRLAAVSVALAILLGGCGSASENEKRQTPDWIGQGTAQNDTNATAYSAAAENDRLLLELNRDTLAFRVTVKQTGRVWQSAAQDDPSQLQLSYCGVGGTVGYMNSYDDAVKKGQYRIEDIDGGFRVKYSLGNIENRLLGAQAMSVEHYEAVTAQCSPKDKQILNSVYRYADIKEETDKDKRAQLTDTYPSLADGPLYVMRSTSLSGSVRKQLDAVLRQAGYTEAMQEQDDRLCVATEEAAEPRFNITVEYRLDGDTLRVCIPADGLFYYEKMPIETLSLLPGFAQPQPGDSGYYLLPDGSGSVMNFYNGKGDLQEYNVPIYGNNEDLLIEEKVVSEQAAILPLFGCRNVTDGFLATIVRGASLANVVASPGSDRLSPYAYFRLRITEKAQMEAISVNSTLLNKGYYSIHEQNPYAGDIEAAYHFLSGEDSDYSGMAACARETLGLIGEAPAQTPLVAELIGAVDVTENTVGITTRRQKAVTDLERTAAIARELKTDGATGLIVRLSGYLKGGYRQEWLSGRVWNRALGRKNDYAALIAALRDADIPTYLDGDIQMAYRGGLFGLNLSRDVSRYLSKQVAAVYPTSPASFQPDTDGRPGYLLKAAATVRQYEALLKAAEQIGADGLSLRRIGAELHGDYAKTDGLCREDTLTRLTETVSKAPCKLMLSGGQAALANAASIIVDLPMSGAGYDITDYSVPFAAMVYSGRVAYTGACANLEYGDESDYLRLIESGAGLYVRLCDGDGTQLQKTDFSMWYSIGYSVQRDSILARYAWLSEALEGCAGTTLLRHEHLTDDVVCSTFSGGWRIYVNYGSSPYTSADGVVIPAQGYKRVKEAA